MSLNTNTLPTASDLSSEKRSVCLINDSFPPVIDGVANAVTNYASIIQRSFGDATVVTPYYPDADDSIYPFPVLRYPSIDVTKLVGYRAGLPLSPELMAQVEGRHIDLIHSHCPVTSTILARMLRQRLHVPLVFTYHTKFDIDIANAIHSKPRRRRKSPISGLSGRLHRHAQWRGHSSRSPAGGDDTRRKRRS